jgi:hypothetical protein
MGIPTARTFHDSIKLAQLRAIGRYSLILKLISVGSILSCPFWLGSLFFTSPRDYDYTSSLVCVPLLAIACAVAVAHVTQNDPYLRQLLMTGLVMRVAAASLFLWVGWFMYGGAVDAFHYWTVGLQISEDFKIIGWSAFHAPYWSTNLINNICGVMALLIGDALPTLFVAFAFVALWGGYFFLRAFTIAFPDGNRWLFGVLVILAPSILFWSSSSGKDALIQFFIAVTCYGFARLTHRAGAKGVLLCAVGLAGVLLVRAHVAAMLAIGMTFPYAVGRSGGRGATNLGLRILLILLLLGGTYFVVGQAGSFLGLKEENTSSGIQEAETVTENTQIGGSVFNSESSLPVRIAESPFLMFRPFPWEVHNTMALIAAVESTGWLLLCWIRRREIWSALRDWRDPYVGFILMYLAIFCVAFAAAISNFGILMRQRIMMVPLALMLICAKQKVAIGPDRRRILRNRWRRPSVLRPNPISSEAWTSRS